MFSNFKVCENGKLTVKVKKKVAKGAPEPGGGGRIIVCGIFLHIIIIQMSPCLSLTEMFRMRVVRPAVLQWRHHHRPFLLEVSQDLRRRENGKISLWRLSSGGKMVRIDIGDYHW